MRVLILGGDGYLGWPTAMHFSSRGHEVHVVDNYLRRAACTSRQRIRLAHPDPLAARPASTPGARSRGREIGCHDRRPDRLRRRRARLPRASSPEAIVHYGEQPSAPYSMASREHAVYTQINNVVNTLNVLFAMRDITPDAHLVKLGHDGRVRHAEHRHRGGLHRDRPQRPAGPPAVPEAAGLALPPARRSTTRTTSTSPAASGGCAPPT